LIVRGIVGVVFGLVAFAWPGITITALVAIFAAYAVIDGVTNLFLGLSRRPGRERSWASVIQGIVGIAAGVLAVIWPGVTALALVIFIGAWAIVTGIFEIFAAIKLRKEIKGEWLLALSGLLSVMFGVLVFAFPAAGAVGISWILGIYAMAGGIVLIALGVRLRATSIALKDQPSAVMEAIWPACMTLSPICTCAT
jgi:uncharacterized membrane protein HdeD (DUF308 family)